MMVVLLMSKTGSKKGNYRFYSRVFLCRDIVIAFILILITYIMFRKNNPVLRVSFT